MSIGVIFPGQGSQRPGMGRAWAGEPSWLIVERAEQLLDRPLGHLLLDASADELRATAASQLSVLLASLMAWEAVGDALGEPPAVLAGHSLGQVTALLASGVLAEPIGLCLAAARADATQTAAEAQPGVMVALLGASEDQAAEACSAAPEACWVANLNGPGQIVIAGTSDGVAAAKVRATAIGVRRLRDLDVGGAFHTPLMSSAAEQLHDVLDTTRFSAPSVPVVTNHDAVDHHDSLGWPERLRTHLVSPVRWSECVQTMVDLGVDRFVEVGPGNALAGLIRRIAPQVSTINVVEPADLATLAEALAGESR